MINFDKILIMEVSYYLKRPSAPDQTSIYARICYEGNKMKYYISESINPKFWNAETHRAKESQKFKEYPEFNTRLDHIVVTIKSAFRRYKTDNDGFSPTVVQFKEVLDEEFKAKRSTNQKNKTFIGFFDEFIAQSQSGTRLNMKSGKPINPGTVKNYLTVIKNVKDFAAKKNKRVDFSNIDLEFYNDFTDYLIKEKKLSTNYIGKNIQIIKSVLNEATERGINKNLAYKSKRFVNLTEKVDSIYLTTDEMQEILELDLSIKPSLERVRDLFLVGCYTGLRFSDFSILEPKNFKGGMIEITQTKTGDSIMIPIHPVVHSILNKYDGKLPVAISNQKTNNHLKEIGELVKSLQVRFDKTYTKAGMLIHKSFYKWELLTTHTARRSFATNQFLEGVPSITIMAITGHRTEKSFMKYIKVTPREHAILLQGHWMKSDLLTVVK